MTPDTFADYDTVAALDLNRLAEIVSRADLRVSLRASARLAAERGDADVLTHHCKQVRLATTQVFELVKALGSAEPDR